MIPGTDVGGAADRPERPDAGPLWLPALLLSALAILHACTLLSCESHLVRARKGNGN